MDTSVAGHQRLPTWVLGFHGCDEKVGMEVLTNPSKHLKPSENVYDWLGNGIYFWENDPVRALQFATEGMAGKVTKGKIKKPFVVGAVIDLGLCCNLFDQAALQELRRAHDAMKASFKEFDLEMPVNGKGHFVRPLDRLVIEHLHALRALVNGGLPAYQTVRSGFTEGEPLYPGTSICEKNHIQIAVRDPSCIKGYFRPRGLS
ncbi:hypothetical protein [Variovorax saccharolyticus]|uniref:hypothetical protein n=1 Tax=Variovorax saccharolyticus TaxID=3053516 RepID=UPI0025781F65|nr:hypothetical protein [Variovorax sp. J31P216]MDM0030461.1 hypothetical protein [Variovorax sp. J31P216]